MHVKIEGTELIFGIQNISFLRFQLGFVWVQIEGDTAKYSSHQHSAWKPNRVWKSYPKTENWPSSNESPPKPDCSNTLQSKQNFS